MKKKLLSLALALVMCLGLTVSVSAASDDQIWQSRNVGMQKMSNQTIHSYLYRRADGNYTRVECEDYWPTFPVEVYDQNFKLLSYKEIPAEGTLWGGFFAGERYNFAVFGTYNFSKDNEAESIRVVKYSKDWERLDCWIGRGMNTTRAFGFGKLRMAEHDNLLYIHTCHDMYIGHQANMSLVLDQEKMSLEGSLTGVSYRNHGYVSHSFNQFVVVDSDGTRATLDHGDGYPRAFTVTIFPAGKGAGVSCIDLEHFPGETGDNATGASAGGFEASGTHYLAAVCSDKSGNRKRPRDVTIYAVNKATKEVTSVQLTNDGMASTPQMVKLADNRFLVLWENMTSDRLDTTGIGYAVLDGSGKLVGQVKTAGARARLSDCKPIAVDGKALWYVTDLSVPTFYTLDSSGLKSYTAAAGTGTTTPAAKPANVAYASTQKVDVDGKAVKFEMYALKDASGNDTNYIKLRDLASVLSGTAAQFEVGWDGAVNIETGKGYTANGSEMSTPFSGNRAYEAATAETRINGTAASLTAIVLKDDQDGAYTYYQLRDLGKALGFNVSWSAARGIFVETGKPYEG